MGTAREQLAATIADLEGERGIVAQLKEGVAEALVAIEGMHLELMGAKAEASKQTRAPAAQLLTPSPRPLGPSPPKPS